MTKNISKTLDKYNNFYDPSESDFENLLGDLSRELTNLEEDIDSLIEENEQLHSENETIKNNHFCLQNTMIYLLFASKHFLALKTHSENFLPKSFISHYDAEKDSVYYEAEVLNKRIIYHACNVSFDNEATELDSFFSISEVRQFKVIDANNNELGKAQLESFLNYIIDNYKQESFRVFVLKYFNHILSGITLNAF